MRKLLFFLFFCGSLLGCKDNYINRIENMSIFVNDKDWQYKLKDDAKKRYIVTKSINNEYSEIMFRVDNFQGKENLIIDYHYKKKKKTDHFEVFYFSKQDTLCSFIIGGDSIFIMGKYYYLYEIDRLYFFNFKPNSKQVDFYYNNRDSLVKVRGNILPELPESN